MFLSYASDCMTPFVCRYENDLQKRKSHGRRSAHKSRGGKAANHHFLPAQHVGPAESSSGTFTVCLSEAFASIVRRHSRLWGRGFQNLALYTTYESAVQKIPRGPQIKITSQLNTLSAHLKIHRTLHLLPPKHFGTTAPSRARARAHFTEVCTSCCHPSPTLPNRTPTSTPSAV